MPTSQKGSPTGFWASPRFRPTRFLPSKEGFFNLVRRQAMGQLHFLDEALTAKASLCDRVAVVHTETITRLLESEHDKTLFPELRNRTTKLARSRAAANGKRVFDSIGKRPATNEELGDTLIEPLPQHEFKVIARKQQAARSRSPLLSPSRPRSRSPRPRPWPPNCVVQDPPTDKLLSDPTSPINWPPMPTQPDDARPTITNVLPNLKNNLPVNTLKTRPPQVPRNSRPMSSPVSELFSRNINNNGRHLSKQRRSRHPCWIWGHGWIITYNTLKWVSLP